MTKDDEIISKSLTSTGIAKNRTPVSKNHRGSIPGIEVGSCWWTRIQVC